LNLPFRICSGKRIKPKAESTEERFFVEVKERNQITDNQKTLFPLIQKCLCPVFIARVIAEVVS
jgi:hypothetical protein